MHRNNAGTRAPLLVLCVKQACSSHGIEDTKTDASYHCSCRPALSARPSSTGRSLWRNHKHGCRRGYSHGCSGAPSSHGARALCLRSPLFGRLGGDVFNGLFLETIKKISKTGLASRQQDGESSEWPSVAPCPDRGCRSFDAPALRSTSCSSRSTKRDLSTHLLTPATPRRLRPLPRASAPALSCTHTQNTHAPKVNFPKLRRTFCKGKKCRKHTQHKVTQYKAGKSSNYAQGT